MVLRERMKGLHHDAKCQEVMSYQRRQVLIAR